MNDKHDDTKTIYEEDIKTLNFVRYAEKSDAKYLEPIKKQSVDLFLCFCGIEECSPGHAFGPAVRSQYVIHYIIKGKGTYYVNNKSYELKENDGFLICPDVVSYYKADKDDPWYYTWIAFNGVKSKTYLSYANLDENNVTFSYSKDNALIKYISEMLKLKDLNHYNELKLEGLLYLFMSTLAESRKDLVNKTSYKTTELYLEKAIEFIEKNYSKSIKVNDIADYIGINRCYLTNIFKKNINVSPQDFLANYRIDKACELLKTTNLSLMYVANCVGYSNSLTFSRAFKKYKNESPRNYRQKFVSAIYIY